MLLLLTIKMNDSVCISNSG